MENQQTTPEKPSCTGSTEAPCSLLPCPFCGEVPTLHKSHFTYTVLHVCYAVQSTIGRGKKKDVVKLWNCRVGGWANVKDKLPEPGAMIVATGLDDGDQVSELGFRSENDIEMFMEQGQWLDFYFDVTHWIHLPDMPK